MIGCRVESVREARKGMLGTKHVVNADKGRFWAKNGDWRPKRASWSAKSSAWSTKIVARSTKTVGISTKIVARSAKTVGRSTKTNAPSTKIRRFRAKNNEKRGPQRLYGFNTLSLSNQIKK